MTPSTKTLRALAEREHDSYLGLDKHTIKLAKALKVCSEVIELYEESMKTCAFHHPACAANWYSDKTKENWNGIGEHREAKPCTCARARIDEALTKAQELLSSLEKGE